MVCLEGELLVDLRGGHADRAAGRPWQRDTFGFADPARRLGYAMSQRRLGVTGEPRAGSLVRALSASLAAR